MGKDLTGMIEEINAASANLNKTSKSDEPVRSLSQSLTNLSQTNTSTPQISQIVRILNSHLSQLQQIDQGTAALQNKVAQAQAASQGVRQSAFGSSVNGLGGNGLGSASASEGFMRSYMGGRR